MSHHEHDIGGVAPAEKPIFAALLTPHRSLSPRGFAIIMAVVAVICVTNAIFYYKLGAWPVAIFMIGDVALLWLAFHLNYRAGRAREEIMVSRRELTIRKIAANGRTAKHSYNPFWARFHVDRHEEIGITSMRVAGEGKSTVLGQFLNPDDRESFATAFSSALATAKR